jgi:hypothetical protein
MTLNSFKGGQFKQGDFVKCVHPHGSHLKHGRIYIIEEILDGMLRDDAGMLTQHIRVVCAATLNSVEYGFFATRFESV